MEKVIIVGGRDTTLIQLALTLAKHSSEEASRLKIILKEEYGIEPATLRKEVGLPIEKDFECLAKLSPKLSGAEIKVHKKSGDKAVVYMKLRDRVRELAKEVGFSEEESDGQEKILTSLFAQWYDKSDMSVDDFWDFLETRMELKDYINEHIVGEGMITQEQIDNETMRREQLETAMNLGKKGGRLFSAAMTNSKFNTFTDFYNNVRENKSSPRKEQFNIVTKNGVPLRVIHDVVNHDYNNHILTVDEWETLFRNIDKVELGATSQKKPRFSGKPIVLKVRAKDKFYGVALELFENKNPIITTAFIDKEGSIDNWIKNEISPSGTKHLTFLGTNLSDIIYDVFPDFKKNVISGARLYSRVGYNEDMNKQAKAYFGTTNNINEAGYILNNGELLDFSGKNQGARGGYRTLDHRDIKDAFDVQDDGADESLVKFINNGNIRFMPEENAFFMANSPTSEQLKQIKKIADRADGEIELELYSEANDWNDRDKVFYRQYNKGTDFKVIKRDIDGFFGGGTSKANRFYSRTDRIQGAFDRVNNIIEIAQEHNPDVFLHEMSHVFFTNYMPWLEESGRSQEAKAIYKLVGKNNINEFDDNDWEKITEVFLQYVRTGNAPNMITERTFEKAKDWIITQFRTISEDYEVSDEIKDFFDTLIADESDISELANVKTRIRDIENSIKQHLDNQEVTFKGQSASDIKALKRAFHTRRPRAGTSLTEHLRKAGGIEPDSGLGKQLGYDSKKKQRVFKKGGR